MEPYVVPGFRLDNGVHKLEKKIAKGLLKSYSKSTFWIVPNPQPLCKFGDEVNEEERKLREEPKEKGIEKLCIFLENASNTYIYVFFFFVIIYLFYNCGFQILFRFCTHDCLMELQTSN